MYQNRLLGSVSGLCGWRVFLLLLLAASGGHAATIWNGPFITYTQPSANPTQAANQDRITADVWLTRAASKGLFNAFSETNATTLSPANTEWAYGALSNYTTLNYTNWLALLNGLSPTTLVGQPVVVHLVSDDIYVAIRFTNWVAGGSGGFAYERSTPTPLSVTITNLGAAAVFAAPANVTLAAGTPVGSAVTNVQFFANGSSLGTVLTPPFTLTANNLAAGSFSFAAVAIAGGISATSPVVNISVVTPVTVGLSAPEIDAGRLVFNYTANIGLSYVVECSTNLEDWTPCTTNIAVDASVNFTNSAASPGTQFFRVGRMPNP